MSILSTVVAVVASMTVSAVQQPQPDVTIYRSWQSPNVTIVEGMFRVDSQLLGTSDCAYGVELTVHDADGTQLTQSEWTGQCPVADGVQVAGLETFRFNVVPATYTVTVAVYPQGRPERRATRTIEVVGLTGDPLASDLVLAREVAVVDTADDGSWTLRRGAIGIRASSQMVVQTGEPSLAYYLELYPDEDAPMTGTVFGVVRRRDGRELARFQLQTIDGIVEPWPVAGKVSLEGLPPGSYSFETRVQLADTAIIRSHPFLMGTVSVADAAGGRGWFWTLSDEQLSELFDPVVVWLTSSEAELFRTLPPDARREFLSQQFGRTGPTPDDGEESALDAYLTRAQTVMQRYGERAGRGTQDAWRTDRGRIYLLRGAPSQVITRPSPQGGAPYELWHYAGGQSFVYLFADETQMGNFRLMYTNDPAEQNVPGWERRLGGQAIEDLERAGVRPRTEERIPPQ
jgi:GWxTD domain-containing protein